MSVDSAEQVSWIAESNEYFEQLQANQCVSLIALDDHWIVGAHFLKY